MDGLQELLRRLLRIQNHNILILLEIIRPEGQEEIVYIGMETADQDVVFDVLGVLEVGGRDVHQRRRLVQRVVLRLDHLYFRRLVVDRFLLARGIISFLQLPILLVLPLVLVNMVVIRVVVGQLLALVLVLTDHVDVHMLLPVYLQDVVPRVQLYYLLTLDLDFQCESDSLELLVDYFSGVQKRFTIEVFAQLGPVNLVSLSPDVLGHPLFLVALRLLLPAGRDQIPDQRDHTRRETALR
jgi:hypothetical protein